MRRTLVKKANLLPKGAIGQYRLLLERFLYRRGFTNAEARLLVALQIMVASALIIIGLACFYFTPWLFWVAVGALLALVNFYFVAKKVQILVPGKLTRGNIIRLVLNFYFRIICTALILAALIIKFGASTPALLIGVSLSAGVAMIFGLTKLHMFKIKEA